MEKPIYRERYNAHTETSTHTEVVVAIRLRKPNM